MRSVNPGKAGFFMLVLFAAFILPLAVLAMGKEPAEIRSEKIEKTQSPDLHGHQRDSGNLFNALGAWVERRRELREEEEEERGRFLPTEDSLSSNGARQ